jgi:phytoene desaturase
MKQGSVIVIGSGVAGMAAAIRLAIQGLQVHVYEKNSYAGGKLSAFQKDGYSFDAGPSLFTQPQNLEELFTLAGENMADYFQYEKIATVCNYFYENGKTVQAYSNLELFADELQEKLGEEKNKVLSYLKESEKIYTNIGSVFLNHSLHKRKTWFNKRILPALGAVRTGYIFNTLNKHNQKHFKTAEAVQLFNRYATYNGSNPYKAPGMLGLIPHLEYTEGTFYPQGGMISITNALHKLAEKKGVQFHFNAPVQKIIHHEGTARGVVVNDENIMADIVVSNIDVVFTYLYLLNNVQKAKKILKQERSSSALVFYWGIKKQFSQLGLHNIFFTKNYPVEFESLFKTKKLYADPTVYINITSKMQSGMAPAGKENWFVMVNAPTNAGQDWNTVVQEAKQNIVQKLNRQLQTDIEPLIETEEILNPVLIEEKTASFQGSLYGSSSNSKWSAFLRHPNFTPTIKNLYCCGGSVHPGGGIPLCFKSAQIVSDLIKTDFRANH